jgi:hypothetical protein
MQDLRTRALQTDRDTLSALTSHTKEKKPHLSQTCDPITTAIFDILTQLAVPVLHVDLGIGNKFFTMLQDRCDYLLSQGCYV